MHTMCEWLQPQHKCTKDTVDKAINQRVFLIEIYDNLNSCTT